MPKIINFECAKGLPEGCRDGITTCCGFRADGSKVFCDHLIVKVKVEHDVAVAHDAGSWF